MKKSIGACFFAAGILSMNGCMKHHATDPLFHIQPNIPQYDVANLPEVYSAGARHYRRYCSQCHILPNPKLHTAQEWREVVSRMIARMKSHRAVANAPSAKKEQIIRDYLERFSKADGKTN